MERSASANWQGDLKQGKGQISTASGVLDATPYSFTTRFESGRGTNPEELIGAAHAGCFSMALSMILGEQGITPERIDTAAQVRLEEADGGFAITAIHLDVTARAPEASADSFEKAANQAKENCPVSKLFNAEISMDARLES